MDEHPNATAYRRTADAFRAGDREALAALIDEDVVWHVPGSGPLAGDIDGREALFRFFDRLRDVTEGTFTIESTTFSAPTSTSSRCAHGQPSGRGSP